MLDSSSDIEVDTYNSSTFWTCFRSSSSITCHNQRARPKVNRKPLAVASANDLRYHGLAILNRVHCWRRSRASRTLALMAPALLEIRYGPTNATAIGCKVFHYNCRLLVSTTWRSIAACDIPSLVRFPPSCLPWVETRYQKKLGWSQDSLLSLQLAWSSGRRCIMFDWLGLLISIPISLCSVGFPVYSVSFCS